MVLSSRRIWLTSAPIVAAFALYACKSDDGPAPERSVLQTVPRCNQQTDCVSGEECLDGLCRQLTAGFDAGLATPSTDCVPGCGVDQLCLNGVCYASASPLDAGLPATDPCGGICTGLQTCNRATGQCDGTL